MLVHSSRASRRTPSDPTARTGGPRPKAAARTPPGPAASPTGGRPRHSPRRQPAGNIFPDRPSEKFAYSRQRSTTRHARCSYEYTSEERRFAFDEPVRSQDEGGTVSFITPAAGRNRDARPPAFY